MNINQLGHHSAKKGHNEIYISKISETTNYRKLFTSTDSTAFIGKMAWCMNFIPVLPAEQPRLALAVLTSCHLHPVMDLGESHGISP